MMQPRIAICADDTAEAGEGAPHRANEPSGDAQRQALAAAVTGAGGRLVEPVDAQGMVWLSARGASALAAVLDTHPGISWVQLPWAGVENLASAGVLNRPVTFTCAKGAFAGQVAEHALALTLATLRNLVHQARTPTWHSLDPRSLHGARVTILGGGGIATELLALLAPFGCRVTVVRRRAEELPGASRTLPVARLHDVLPHTDVLVLALALTPDTRTIIGERELDALPSHAVVVNVARGAHLHTEALLQALKNDTIGGAALDVTDPEPLPDGHPLWADPRVLITSHCADSADYVVDRLSRRVASNVRRLSEGRELEGVVEPGEGY